MTPERWLRRLRIEEAERKAEHLRFMRDFVVPVFVEAAKLLLLDHLRRSAITKAQRVAATKT